MCLPSLSMSNDMGGEDKINRPRGSAIDIFKYIIILDVGTTLMPQVPLIYDTFDNIKIKLLHCAKMRCDFAQTTAI